MKTARDIRYMLLKTCSSIAAHNIAHLYNGRFSYQSAGFEIVICLPSSLSLLTCITTINRRKKDSSLQTTVPSVYTRYNSIKSRGCIQCTVLLEDAEIKMEVIISY